MKLKNVEILDYTNLLETVFKEDKKYIPMKIGFAIQKNFSVLSNLAKDINIAREKICNEYGEVEEGTNYYIIKKENIEIAKKEFNDLLNFEQEVDIKTVKLSDIEKFEFTFSQTQALMFMIEEEE